VLHCQHVGKKAGQLSAGAQASHPRMSTIQISRGPAALPSDLEYRFRIAFGREMNLEERRLLGIVEEEEEETDTQRIELDRMPKAA
jgi:hypothetical protein